jgi:dTDP-4-dehydrorhamnose 3,5-epimerase
VGGLRFEKTELDGALVVRSDPHQDQRGSFARAFSRDEFAAAGAPLDVVQANLSFSRLAGTVRGLHWQYPPAAEAKLVRCTRGAVLDVVVDLRPESVTFGRHVGVRLSADNRAAIYVPPRFAHGYQTLVDDTEVGYQVSHAYTPDAEGGLRPDDPGLGITWPLPVAAVSDRDTAWPDLAVQLAELQARMAAS